MVSPQKQRSHVRTVSVVLALICIVGVGVALVYQRRATIQNLLESEREDAAALAEVAAAPVEISPPSSGAGWPQWRGPNRDGVAPAGRFRTDWSAHPPKNVWTVPCGGGYSSPVVVGGKVYIQDRKGDAERVLCLDGLTGKELWAFESLADYGGIGYAAGPRATPTFHDGRLYSVGASGDFICLDVSGSQPREIWRHNLCSEFRADIPGWGMACSPLVVGDRIVVQPGGKDGSVAAFDRTSGELQWSAGSSPNGYSSPIAATLGGIRQVVAVTGDTVIGVRVSDGKLLWSHPWVTEHRGNIATPIALGDHVFLSSNYGKGCALLTVSKAGDGVQVTEVYFRKNRAMQNHHSTCVVRGDHLYGYDGSTLKCLAWRTGQPVPDWEGQADDGRVLAKGSVILAGEHLVGLTETGTLFLAEATPEEFRFRGQVAGVLSGRENWSLPALVEGRVYLRDGEKVVCLDASP